MKLKLLKAKMELYRLLMVAEVDDLTEIDLDLMVLLAKDEGIQRQLQKGVPAYAS